MKNTTRARWLLLLLIWPVSSVQAASRLSDGRFQELILELSEPAGYFDTDNLISNESSYLHVVPTLRERIPPHQVYLGVGPDQNFSYVAHLRPRLAFIIDIRRDNLLEHMYFKGLFLAARSRWDYLSLLFGKPLPARFHRNSSATAQDLVKLFKTVPSERDFFESNFAAVWENLRRRYPQILTEEDRKTVHRIGSAFSERNLQLKYNSHGRRPRPYYPSLEHLLTETDLSGQMGSYLHSEERFQILRRMQLENRFIPLVGDFSGAKSLRRLGRFLKESGQQVGAFYLSNVEFYLFRDDSFGRFVGNLQEIPFHPKAVFIRSYFSYWQPHPETVPGYFVTSLLQSVERFLQLSRELPFRDYWDLTSRDYIPILSSMEYP